MLLVYRQVYIPVDKSLSMFTFASHEVFTTRINAECDFCKVKIKLSPGSPLILHINFQLFKQEVNLRGSTTTGACLWLISLKAL